MAHLSQFCGLGFQQTGHILDAEYVYAFLHELVHEVEVVLQRVLRLLGAGNVSAVTHDSLDNTTSLLRSVDTQSHLKIIVHGGFYDGTDSLTFSIPEKEWN
jgi:hypothetical protein